MSATNTNRWKLGLFVTLGIALSIGSLMWLGISQLQRRTTPAYFYFKESVNGLEVGSPVKFLGVEVGRVDDVFPAPDRRHIEVRAGIYVDTLEAWGISPSQFENRIAGQSFVSEDIRGQLKSSALTSVAFIQLGIFDIEKNPVPSYNFPIPWETIHTVPSTFKSLETGIMEALERWPELSALAQDLMRSVNQGVVDLELGVLSREFQETLVTGRSLMDKLRDSPLVDSGSPTLVKLQGTLDEVGGLAAELRGEGGQVDRVVDRFDSLGAAIEADFEGSDIPGAVEAMRDAGQGMTGASDELVLLLRELRSGISNLESTLSSIGSLADVLSRDPGALLHGKASSPAPFRRQ